MIGTDNYTFCGCQNVGSDAGVTWIKRLAGWKEVKTTN